MFDWCQTGQHDICRRRVRRFMVDHRTRRVVWLDEWRECDCLKRGCACYTKPADRVKKKKTNRRGKKL